MQGSLCKSKLQCSLNQLEGGTKDKYTQVLKDADLRAAYNKQLDREGYKVGVFISNEVCIGTQCVKTGLELRWKSLLEEIQVLQPDS